MSRNVKILLEARRLPRERTSHISADKGKQTTHRTQVDLNQLVLKAAVDLQAIKGQSGF